LGVEHGGEHVVLRRVVAVEGAEGDPGFGGDLLRGDAVELAGPSQAGSGRQDRGATGLLVIRRRQRGSTLLTDSRHVASIGSSGGYAAGVPVSGTGLPISESLREDLVVVDSARYGRDGPFGRTSGVDRTRLLSLPRPCRRHGRRGRSRGVCESVLLVKSAKGFAVYRAGANHFRLHRRGGRWQIVHRTTRALDGGTDARRLPASGVTGQAL
jgi:hypothetical protein